MSNTKRKKKFDCIKFTREARARSAAATAHMTIDERVEYFNTRHYSNPVLEEMAAKIREAYRAKSQEKRDD